MLLYIMGAIFRSSVGYALHVLAELALRYIDNLFSVEAILLVCASST